MTPATSTPSRPLRLIHTGDVHLESDTLGSGPAGERLRQRVREAFSNVVSIANEREADLMLIVGDLFDSSRIERRTIEFALAEIARARMEVIMVPGNHDAHDERSIYSPLTSDAIPPNLHLILEPEGRTIEFPELHVRVWGRALIEHSPNYRPLAGLPSPAAGRWNIALAHGLFTEDNESERSSRISAAEIATSAYDYVALGHVHVFADVSQGATRAFYCGTPAPLHSNGHRGSIAEVRLLPGVPPSVERISIDP